MSNSEKVFSGRETLRENELKSAKYSVNSKNTKTSYEMSSSNKICFTFSSGTKLYFNQQNVKDCCFNLKEDSQRIVSVKVPENIEEEDLKNFISYSSYINKGNLFTNYTFETIQRILIVCEFFENYLLLQDIIFNYVIPNLNFNNSLNLLGFSYTKISILEVKEIYFRLFYEAINFISKNFIFFLERFLTTLVNINKKILEEILSK
jgi:hypothetical protein